MRRYTAYQRRAQRDQHSAHKHHYVNRHVNLVFDSVGAFVASFGPVQRFPGGELEVGASLAWWAILPNQRPLARPSVQAMFPEILGLHVGDKLSAFIDLIIIFHILVVVRLTAIVHQTRNTCILRVTARTRSLFSSIDRHRLFPT